ncbi:MAG TPA: hypothetical protein VE890_16645 [Thermoguttaceae bacterium]|nr:hypothetical protein [Thermoguttaceae bacterium]
MTSRGIQFRPPIDPFQYKRCRCAVKELQEGNFAQYREVFERCFAEQVLMTGQLGTVRMVPVAVDPMEQSSLGQLLGNYAAANDRLRWAGEFFDLYEQCDERRFLRREMFNTQYVQQMIDGPGRYDPRLRHRGLSKRQCREKVRGVLCMYRRMKEARGLVPDSKSEDGDGVWRYYDFPLAIDYYGYIKKRDGSHRRMVAAYLGLTHIESLVLDVAALTDDDLRLSPSYVRDHFPWFRETILATKNAMAAA